MYVQLIGGMYRESWTSKSTYHEYR